jgi:hypothetical protein
MRVQKTRGAIPCPPPATACSIFMTATNLIPPLRKTEEREGEWGLKFAELKMYTHFVTTKFSSHLITYLPLSGG